MNIRSSSSPPINTALFRATLSDSPKNVLLLIFSSKKKDENQTNKYKLETMMGKVSREDVFLYLIALVVPPVPVYARRHFKSDFWLNLALCFAFWPVAVLHSWYIISKGSGRYHTWAHKLEERFPVLKGKKKTKSSKPSSSASSVRSTSADGARDAGVGVDGAEAIAGAEIREEKEVKEKGDAATATATASPSTPLGAVEVESEKVTEKGRE